jgi:HEAT repeat protein
MVHRTSVMVAILAAAVLLGAALPAVADEALDKAFETLKTFDWGHDRNQLKPIDDAVIASHGDAAALKALEVRLAAVLDTDAPHCAKDFVCRTLSLIGTAESVPALAKLLGDEKLSHMARYALERIPAPEAVAAMRDALPKVGGLVKVGVINSLGVRRDAASTAALAALLGDSDKQIASAAAAALGSIGTTEAAKALAGFQDKAPADLKTAAADAYLVCAERLLADGKRTEAVAIYKALSAEGQPRHVRMAAMRGMLSAAGTK